MGWSGYHPRFFIDVRVDAHGGEREQRGEKLYAELIDELDKAITQVIRQEKYADPDALRISYDGNEWVTNEVAG